MEFDPRDFIAKLPGAKIVAVVDKDRPESPNHPLLSKLRDILNKYVTSKHVVLALTELSLLVELQKGGGKSGKVLIDPMNLYAEALVADYLGLPAKLSPTPSATPSTP